MKVLLDNGHGRETPGKRSPVWSDGSQLFEWEFNRDIVKRIAERLKVSEIDAVVIVQEETDIALGERCRRVNKYGKDALLISIHANAGGGTGWECYTSPGQTESDNFARILCDQARLDLPEWKMRFDISDGDPDKEEAFFILKNTICPAILTENFFMDTETDCRFIMSSVGRERIARMHATAIIKMLNQR